MYNYTIKFDAKQNIFIFHGLNGYGKTTILEMIHCCLSGDFHELRKYSFKKLQLTLDDKRSITINHKVLTKADLNRERNTFFRHRRIRMSEEEELFYRLREVESQNAMGYYLTYKMDNESKITNKLIDDDDKRDRRQDFRFIRHPLKSGKILSGTEESGANKNIEDYFPIAKSSLIETKRLLSKDKERGSSSKEERMINLPNEISKIIREKEGSYAKKSQTLDGQFPEEVIKSFRKKDYDNEEKLEIKKRLKNLETDAENLKNIGLLKREGGNISTDQEYQEGVLPLLEVYCNNTEQKLGIWNDIYKKLNLFLTIINDKLNNKKLLINNEDFRLYAEDKAGKNIPLNRLSSGEQHIIIMFFDLIFHDKYEVMLVDEPEISLHPAWQVSFIQDLKNIQETLGGNRLILIATHSPTIIGDEWDSSFDLVELAQLENQDE